MDRVLRLLKEGGGEDVPYRLEISYGAGFYRGGTVDDFMKDMDDSMYRMKAEHHNARV
jgi:hypothetical protein